MTSDDATEPFYLRSFTATETGSTNPVTEFGHGETFELRWDSNGTAFTVYAARDHKPLYSGPSTSIPVQGGRTRATTFVLVASALADPERPGSETVTLTDALTVEIRNPALTPRSVTTVSLTVTGASTLHDVQASDVETGRLQVTGDARLVGNLAVGGTSTFSGGVYADTLDTSQTLATGRSTLGDATATSLSVTDRVSMMGSRTITAGTHRPSTDGLVVGTVWWPDANQDYKSTAIATGTSGGLTVYATGGNDVMWRSGSDSWMWHVGNSFTLPVRKDTPFTVQVAQIPGHEKAARSSFVWVPFGPASTLTAVSDEQAAAEGHVAPPLPGPEPAGTPSPDPGAAVAEIVAVLGEALGGGIGTDDGARLTEALRALAGPGADGSGGAGR